MYHFFVSSIECCCGQGADAEFRSRGRDSAEGGGRINLHLFRQRHMHPDRSGEGSLVVSTCFTWFFREATIVTLFFLSPQVCQSLGAVHGSTGPHRLWTVLLCQRKECYHRRPSRKQQAWPGHQPHLQQIHWYHRGGPTSLLGETLLVFIYQTIFLKVRNCGLKQLTFVDM